MKGSDFGAKVPSTVGEWAYATCEDGNGDGVWRNSASSREEAIEELKAECEEDGADFHGYVAELREVAIRAPDAERLVEGVGEWAWDKFGEVAEDWPKPTKAQLDVLQDRLNKVFGEWLTEFDLWPGFTSLGPLQEVTAIDLPHAEGECD